ncbi:ABC transporter ATP-binding protein [Streptomyces rapamycinicus]|uniref:Spermidine/putrescine ABC transporter ATP-binding protein n=2 Tax=Streptomyces rapamycinicus TaxID=1226757 RepID=A0A0A0NU98_STRRN|nr:ABC transporter ATP-binding protein [Streptomyces rapamycinicus]AGP60103.1 spermidine/putrescine ABC transporter ATP-binding protein [Streptomyces rapamycinicus NRRL 5491]MBB4788740.1 putative spermidine/putrescine transport system ATP-binding protein [Streptomyces rapamycinicus]RLV76714.1 spermidine/putrescine ABC transporter ATP-binding protein [Streptomyces rapamycinicus NRRL 5491]UTO67746.1 ABC transporter ATP-binding protein [Streptomyces rapamycinicus]UTP35692.1 ABC transporter ATP-bi
MAETETRTRTGTTTTRTAVRLEAVTKDFGTVRAVDAVDLTVHEGEFFSLLGPSGSGKTTLLRLVAGFEQPTSGRIELAGDDVTTTPPNRRDAHTVFQDYALFPHMSVEQNVAYALTVRGVRKAERLARAREALTTVRLDGFAGRRPAELSGGQRQRVALARALVDRPAVLLLDEPLGALDLALRQEMQTELKELQRTTGITFLLVTHDQDEALTMSDRIAVVRDGRIEQTGPPVEVYERPATAFVAGFVGTTNLLRGEAAVRVVGRPGTYSIRPERILLTEPVAPPAVAAASADGRRTVTGRITDIVHAGAHTRFTIALPHGDRLTVLRQNLTGLPQSARPDGEIGLSWDEKDAFPVPS